MIFYNGLSYNYKFIIKESAKEFEKEFDCFFKKYKNFLVPAAKEVKKIGKNGE